MVIIQSTENPKFQPRNQTDVEAGLIKILIEGLRTTMAEKVLGNACFFRKPSTLRFIARSFKRHLERLFSLEENDGYMDLVKRKAARLSKTVDALKLEHDHFRTGIRLIVHDLERVSLIDPARFAILCGELSFLLGKLEEHARKEAELCQEAFERNRFGER